MVEQTNLETVSNEMEKENPLTAEALASTLLTKDNLELKTDIPFSDPVWNTALMKSVGDMIELDFLELQDVIEIVAPDHEKGKWDDYKIFVKVQVENPDGTKTEVKMSLARYLGELYKRQIKYSEEYAVSENRQGRTEVAEMMGKKFQQPQQRKPDDVLGSMSSR